MDKIQKWCRSISGKYLRPGYEPHMPDRINIEAASACNLRCACCPHGQPNSGMRPAGIMSMDTFLRVLRHIDIPIRQTYLHLHGEPFLNPNLTDFVGELNSRHIAVNLYSNCTVGDEKQWETIIKNNQVSLNFSADVIGEEYYEHLRVGARFKETLDRLDTLNMLFAKYKRFFNLIIILDGGYQERIEELTHCCEQLYARYSNLFKIILGSRFPWPRLPWTGDLDGHLVKGHQRCSYAFEGLSVLWNGDVTMCSFDYTGECVVGSLLDDTYSRLFNNAAARHFRMLHWRHRDNELPLCKDCLLDRYVPMSLTLKRTTFLNNDQHGKKQTIESFFHI